LTGSKTILELCIHKDKKSFLHYLQKRMSSTDEKTPPVTENGEEVVKTASQLKKEAKRLAKMEKFAKKQTTTKKEVCLNDLIL